MQRILIVEDEEAITSYAHFYDANYNIFNIYHMYLYK